MSTPDPNFVDTISLTASDSCDTITVDSQDNWTNMAQGISITTMPTIGGFGSGTSILGGSSQNTIWTTSNVSVDHSLEVGRSGKISVRGDDADIEINGVSLVQTLQGIQERLAILRPNEELEEKWEKLRGLRQAYMELEAEIKEKEKMWESLRQKSNNKA